MTNNILIVDDDLSILKALTRELTSLGHQVQSARNGEEALFTLSHQTFDLLISDFRMPGMSGAELLREIKKLRPTLPAIILSGHADFSDLIELLNDGTATQFVSKPWARKDLAHRIERILLAPPAPTPQVNKALIDELESSQFASCDMSLSFELVADVVTQRAFCAEAYLQCSHPTLGNIDYKTLLKAAEYAGLATLLNCWFSEQVFSIASRTLPLCPPDFSFSMNLSGTRLTDKQLLVHLERMIADYKVVPQNIEIVLAETSLVDDISQCSHFVEEIKSMGFRFSIDGFGTGCTGFQYLMVLPTDGIKLDSSIVAELEHSTRTRRVTQELIFLAKRLGITTTAHGVDTLEQFSLTKRLGCDYIQGSFINKSMNETELHSLLMAREL